MKESLKQAFTRTVEKTSEFLTMAVLFGVGNVPIYAQAFNVNGQNIENIIGLTASVFAALMVSGSRLREMQSDIPKDQSRIPHFTLSAFNFSAAGASALALAHGIVPVTMLSVGMTIAFVGWGAANLARGIEKRDGVNLQGFFRPGILWPLSDMAATIDTMGWPLGLTALLKSQYLDPPNVREMDVNSLADFAIKHMSWDRILMGSYLIAATMSPTYVAIGFLLFAAGYYQNGEFDLNRSFLPDLKRAIGYVHKPE